MFVICNSIKTGSTLVLLPQTISAFLKYISMVRDKLWNKKVKSYGHKWEEMSNMAKNVTEGMYFLVRSVLNPLL